MLTKSEANQVLEVIHSCTCCQTESDLSQIIEKLKKMDTVDLRADWSPKSLAKATTISNHLQPHLRAAAIRALTPKACRQMNDVMLRRREEEALSLTMLGRLWTWQKSLVDNLPDLLMRFDLALRCTFANKAVRDVLGPDPGEVIGKKCAAMGLSPEAANRLEDLLKRIVAAGRPELEEFEIDVNGVGKYLSFRAAPEIDSGTAVRSILVIAQDITERRNLEAQLREAQKLEAVGALSGGVAHDFNNLLAVMLGNSELALDDIPEGSSIFDNIRNIRTAALRGRDLVRQILAFSRNTAGNMRVMPVTPLVEETAKLLRSTIPSTVDIKVETTAVRDSIYGDAGQVQQVLVNLSTNAAQAMPRGGVMTISLKETVFGREPEPGLPPGDYLALCVRDTGHGMDEKTRERIFEPFFTTKAPQGGSGLGLSVVYGIVKAHRGVVTVRSAPGKGSTFTAFLPLVGNREERAAAEAEKEVKGKGRILFVDDEELLVRAARDALSKLGYEVATETEPKKALLTFAESGSFDLVVTDHTMPGMSGLALTEALLRKRPRLPVILCTGYSPGVDEETAKAAGVRAFLMKPYTRTQLSRAVAKVLERQPTRRRG